MKKFSLTLLLMLFMLSALLGCTTASDEINSPVYKGKQLVIGVIGEPPIVREDNVIFKKLTFSELKELHSPSNFDAIFITKENLSEGAEQEYANIYKTAATPFFFIESKKSYLPFTYEELSYEEVPDISADMYATGYFQNDDKFQSWGYGLYNDKLTSLNIEDVYTRVFETINSIPTKKK